MQFYTAALSVCVLFTNSLHFASVESKSDPRGPRERRIMHMPSSYYGLCKNRPTLHDFFLFYWLEGKKNRKAPAAFPADDITAPPAPSFLSHTQSLTLSLAVWLSLSSSDIRVASPGSQAVMFTDCISCQYPHKSTCPHHTHTCNRTPSLCDVYTCFFPIVLLLFVRSTQDAG